MLGTCYGEKPGWSGFKGGFSLLQPLIITCVSWCRGLLRLLALLVVTRGVWIRFSAGARLLWWWVQGVLLVLCGLELPGGSDYRWGREEGVSFLQPLTITYVIRCRRLLVVL